MDLKLWLKSGGRLVAQNCLFLLSNKRLILFIAIPYGSIVSIYHYIFDLSAPLFSLSQIPYLLFKHTAMIQSNLQTNFGEYRFFAFPEWLHYLWIPLICFVFNIVNCLFISFANQVIKTKKAGNLEKALIQVQNTLTNNAYWALVTAGVIWPLGMIWSFSHQIELIREVLFVTSPLFALFITSFIFDLLLLTILFGFQWFSGFILPIIALEQLRFKDTFAKALDNSQLKGDSMSAGLITLAFGWIASRLIVKDYISTIAPIVVNGISLIMILFIYYSPAQLGTNKSSNPLH